MFKKLFFLFLTSAMTLSACGTLEVSLYQTATPNSVIPGISSAPTEPPLDMDNTPTLAPTLILQTPTSSGATLAQTLTPVPTVMPPAPVSSTLGWQSYQNVLYNFSVQYPLDATILITRNEYARIDLAVAQGTSLTEKYVEIAATRDANSCPSKYGALLSSENITLQGLTFLHETGHGVAAGSYDWQSYSTTKDEVCVNLTFVLHFRPDISITPLAEAETFPPILSTFTWTSPSTGNLASLTWKEENYDGTYSFRYPLELYSIRAGSANLAVNWPGVIELSPNDNFTQVLGQPISQTYRILVAVRDNNDGWTTSDPLGFMAGAGVLLQHAPDLIDANHPIKEYRMGEAALFRIDNLPSGLAGAQTHIMTLYNNKIYEWLVEPVQSTGDARNMSSVEAILLTFELK